VKPYRLAAFVIVSATAACSLLVDTSGYSGGESQDGAPEATATDATTGDVGVVDASSDVVVACDASTTVNTPLTVDLGSWVPHERRLSGYPKVASFESTPAAVLFPVVTDPGDGGSNELKAAVSGLWMPTPVPLQAFDVDFDVFVRCTSNGSCADGLLVAWLDTQDPSVLDNPNTGAVGGLPDSTNGAAVVLDDFQNDAPETVDPAPPTIQVISLDPTKPIGGYTWLVSYADVPFLGAWHKVAISVRAGDVHVRYDGADTLTASVKPVTTGLFGFTAGTGGETDAVAIRNVHAAFYACTP
jgi:hypothetical protein